MPGLLDSPLVSRIRRNHGLEHATIHLLSARFPRSVFVGRSDVGGFYLLADVPAEAVAQAAQQALERLRTGDDRLAIHPNCGTNLLTASLLAGTAAYAALAGASSRGWRERLERLPVAILASLLGLILAQPLGYQLQRRVTTQADPRGLEIHSVHTWSRGVTRLHRVRTFG
jgi:plasmid stabilization system protein ParE